MEIYEIMKLWNYGWCEIIYSARIPIIPEMLPNIVKKLNDKKNILNRKSHVITR